MEADCFGVGGNYAKNAVFELKLSTVAILASIIGEKIHDDTHHFQAAAAGCCYVDRNRFRFFVDNNFGLSANDYNEE